MMQHTATTNRPVPVAALAALLATGGLVLAASTSAGCGRSEPKGKTGSLQPLNGPAVQTSVGPDGQPIAETNVAPVDGTVPPPPPGPTFDQLGGNGNRTAPPPRSSINPKAGSRGSEFGVKSERELKLLADVLSSHADPKSASSLPTAKESVLAPAPPPDDASLVSPPSAGTPVTPTVTATKATEKTKSVGGR